MFAESKFTLANRFLIREEDFGGLAFVPSSGEILQLNKVAYKRLTQLLSDKQCICNSENELPFWRSLIARNIVKEV